MHSPYFSIGLATRNRGELAALCVRHVLNQTFRDFELIIGDSDESDDTLERIKQFQDPRIRYHRTRDKTGPENLDFCAQQSRGEYFVLLTDRFMLLPNALDVLYQHSEARRYPSIRYHFDTFDDRLSPPKIWKPEYCQGKNATITPDEVLTQFVGDNESGHLSHIIPMPQFSAIHRTTLEKIRGREGRPVLAPMVPDAWCAFAQLSCIEGEMLNIGQRLSVNLMRGGAGLSFLLKKQSGAKFLKEISKNGELEMAHVPIKSPLTNNMTFNDYLRAQKVFGGRLLNYPLPWATYFVGVNRNFIDSMKLGVSMKEEYREWQQALSQQPIDVQQEVARRLAKTKSYAQLERSRVMKKARYALGIHHLETGLKKLRGKKKKKKATGFLTVSDYIASEAAANAKK